jgi:hypothetical protein
MEAVLQAVLLMEPRLRVGGLREQILDRVRAAQLERDQVIDLVLATVVATYAISEKDPALGLRADISDPARVPRCAYVVGRDTRESGTGRAMVVW